MKIRNQKEWEDSRRTYVKEVIKIAEDLADLIEARMAVTGAPLMAVTSDAIRKYVNNLPMTQPLWDQVISVFIRTWVHGEEFKRWARM